MDSNTSKKLASNKGGERSAQEQLRIDHIETLEVLNQATKDNVDLRVKIAALEKRLLEAGLSLEGDAEPTQDVENTPTNEISYTDLLLQNRNQAKEIQILKDKMRQNALEDQKRFNDIQTRQLMEFSQQLMKMQQKEKDLQSQNKMLEEQLSFMQATNTHLSSLQAELLQLRDILSDKESLLQSKEKDLQQIQELYDECSHANEENKQKLEETMTTLQETSLRNSQLQQLSQSLDEANQEKAQIIYQLQLELESLRKLAALAAKGVVFADSDDEYDPKTQTIQDPVVEEEESSLQLMVSRHDATCQTSPLPSPILARQPLPSIVPPPQVNMQQSIMTGPEEKEEEEGPNGFRFQDFIRLKRENRELKLRLADLTSTASPLNYLGSKPSGGRPGPAVPLGPIQTSNGKINKTGHPSAKLAQIRKV